MKSIPNRDNNSFPFPVPNQKKLILNPLILINYLFAFVIFLLLFDINVNVMQNHQQNVESKAVTNQLFLHYKINFLLF